MRTTLACLIVVFGQLAGAAMWYVSSGDRGSDQPSAGTNATNPFATLGYAISMASGGDTIHLLPGLHTQTQEIYLGTSLTFEGEGMGVSQIYFPSNFTASENVHAFNLYAANVTFRDLSVVRSNFLEFGAIIYLAGKDDYTPQYYDHFLLDRVELAGGTRALLLNPAHAVIRDCVIHRLDAPSNEINGQEAIAFEIVGFSGTVHVAGCYVDGTLLGSLGGTRIRRAFLTEPRGGGTHCAGTLRLESNFVFNVREPFLWDQYVYPATEKATVEFVHNTVDVTEKTPFTFFGYGIGAGGIEYQKFTNCVVRDNLFANLGGTSVGRADYQYGNFARNFPLGGFRFENNLLFINPASSAVDSLGTPLAQDPGWFSGAEFNTNGQPSSLRFDRVTQPSPFADPAHTDGDCAITPLTAAGQTALGGATDGGNIGAWATPQPDVEISIATGIVSLCWSALSNFLYHVESTDVVNPESWSPVGSSVTGTGGCQAVSDTSTATVRWYRVTVDN